MSIGNNKERISCYDDCLYGHDCFGGYLNESKKCDREIAKNESELATQYPKHYVLFAPTNIIGLRFKVIESLETEKVYMLENGEIVPPDAK